MVPLMTAHRLAAFLLLTLSACNQQTGLPSLSSGIAEIEGETVASWQVPNGTAALRRNRLDGSFDTAVQGTTERATFVGYTNVVLKDVHVAGPDTVATFVGTKSDCRNRYIFVIFTPIGIQGARMPSCGPDYVIGSDGNSVFAKQMGPADPPVWAVMDGRLRGPWRQSVLASRPLAPPQGGAAWTPPPQIQVRSGSGADLPSPVPVGPQTQGVPSIRLD